MADEVAKVSVTIDASGAKAGAADVAASAASVVASEEKITKAVQEGEVKQTAARGKRSKAAKDSAAVEAAAAVAGADAIVASSSRTEKANDRMVAALDRYAKAWNPLLGAVSQAQRQLDTISDIFEKTGNEELKAKALSMVTEATNRLVAAQKNLAAGFDVDRRTLELAAKFDKSGTSARAMANELGDLNEALKLGVNIDGGYANAHQKIVLAYDEGAQAALRQREAVLALRQAQQMQTGQAIQADPRTILGLGAVGSARDSASVFEEQMRKQDAIDAARMAQASQSAPDPRTLLGLGGNTGNAAASAQVFQDAMAAQAETLKQTAIATAALGKEMDRLLTAFPTAASQALKYEAALQDIQAAEKLAGMTMEEANAERAKAASMYDSTTIAANKAAKETATAQSTLASTMDRLEGEFRPAAAAAKQYASALQDLDAAAHLLDLTVEETAAAQAKLRQAFTGTGPALQNHTQSAFAARFATQQLGVQTIQFFSSLEAGQPFMMAFIGQAHQVVDVAIATGTGFKVLADGIRSFFSAIGRWMVANPLVSVLIAATGAMVALGAMAESTARRMGELRNALRGTHEDFEALATVADKAAKHLASATEISTSDARKATQAIAEAPQFKGTQAQLEALVVAANDVAKGLGETLPDAAKRFATAMKDPAAAVQEMTDKGLVGFKAGMADQARLLQLAGDKAGAYLVYLKGMRDSFKGAAEDMTPMEKALDDLSKAFTKAGQDGRSFANVLGDAINFVAVGVLKDLADVIRGIEKLRGFISGPSAMPGVATELQRKVPTSVASDIYKQSETLGLRPELADFAVAIAGLESGGHHIDPKTGKPLKSTAGAIGLMQVMPSSAPAGLDISNYDENLKAGLLILQALDKQFAGDLAKIAVGYNAGPGRVGAGALPDETIKYLKSLGLNIPAGNTASAAAAAAAPNAAGVANVDREKEALKAFPGTIAGQREALAAEIDGLKKLRDELGANSAAGQKLTLILGPMEGRLKNLRTATEENTKSLQDATRVAGVEEGAAKRLADEYLRLDEAAIATTGHVATLAQREAARTEILKGLSKEMQLVVVAAERQITANQEMAKAAEEGNGALLKRQALLKAEQEALQYGARGTAEFIKARDVLTQKNIDIAGSEQGIQAGARSHQNEETLAYIKAETDTLMMNNDTRVVYLTHLKAEKELKQSLPFLTQQETDKLLAQADAITKSTLELKRQQDALNTLSGMFEHAFDTISDSITQALATGEISAVKFQNVMMAVAQQIMSAFLKMALVNPLLNLMNPSGNRPDIFSFFGDLAKAGTNITPGSSSTELGGGAGNTTSAISTIVSWGAKLAGLFGGGGGGNWQYDPLKFGDVADVTGTTTGGATLQDLGFFKPLASHVGGIVGANDNLPERLVHSSVFANAPRFHDGTGGDLTGVLRRATDVMARRSGMQTLQPDEIPAVLMRNERVLTQVQDQALKSMIGGMADQLAMFKGTGTDGHRFTPDLPRFHGGTGGSDFASIMRQGQQALSQSPAPASGTAGGDQSAPVNITIDARGSTQESVNTFRRSLPQTAQLMGEQMAKARARNG